MYVSGKKERRMLLSCLWEKSVECKKHQSALPVKILSSNILEKTEEKDRITQSGELQHSD